MTFDLTAEQQDWSRRAREFSDTVVAPLARAIDERGVMPSQVQDELSKRTLGNPFSDGAVAAALAVEEIAAVSAGAGAAIGLQWTTTETAPTPSGQDGMPGLRGSAIGGLRSPAAASDRGRLVLCAVAIGVGRAAVAIAIETMKSRGIRPSGEETTPHWTLADAASELDAARLLTLSAAQVVERGEAAAPALAMAARLAAAAAERTVEAASLVVGVEGYRPGSPLERFTRDARTLKLLLEEGIRHKAH